MPAYQKVLDTLIRQFLAKAAACSGVTTTLPMKIMKITKNSV